VEEKFNKLKIIKTLGRFCS